MATAVLTCHPASPAISGRHNRARLASIVARSSALCGFRDLDPLPQRPFSRVALRKSAQLATGCAFSPGSRVCSRRKCFAGSGNCRRTTGSPHGSRAGTVQHVIVATRASLDQAAPKHGALESAVTKLQRGVALKMESLLERLVGTATNASPRSPPEGNSPSVAALSIFIVAGSNAIPSGILRRSDRIPS